MLASCWAFPSTKEGFYLTESSAGCCDSKSSPAITLCAAIDQSTHLALYVSGVRHWSMLLGPYAPVPTRWHPPGFRLFARNVFATYDQLDGA